MALSGSPFWAEALHSRQLGRVQRVNQHRLASNLRHALRGLVATEDINRVAETIACLIDGVWLRSTLAGGDGHSRQSRALVMEAVDAILDGARPAPAPSTAEAAP